MEPIKAIRTPDERFANLPDYDFAPHYHTVQPDLRMHYIDENPDAERVIVCLHGEPSWSYLYRKMIPFFLDAGFRVVIPDLIGLGRSDKPVHEQDYTYQRHIDWLKELLFEHLQLEGIHLFVQDWGGLLGLRIVGEMPERFARVVAANTLLPTGDFPLGEGFMQWQQMSQQLDPFPVGNILQRATEATLSSAEVAAYDAPFPDESYKAAVRIFPMLVPTTPEDPAAPANRSAWQSLLNFDKPFLTLFSDQDPVTRGGEKVLQQIRGAADQPHKIIQGGGHFLQEDQPEEIAQATLAFFNQS